jgi:hypothetical protein
MSTDLHLLPQSLPVQDVSLSIRMMMREMILSR